MSELSDQWCRTTNDETTKTTFTWTIEDFKSRPEKVGEQITSSIFVAKEPNGKTSSWKLALLPKGQTRKGNEAGNELSIFIHNWNDFPIKAKARISILDSSSKKSNTWDSDVHLFDRRGSVDSSWGTNSWVVRKSLIKKTDLLPEGHLTLFCVLSVYGPDELVSGSQDAERKSGTHARGLEQVIEHFGKLFNDKEFSDVQIECAEEIFNCHINILSTRSEVFRAMFYSDMTENKTKKVAIKGIDSDVAREMLHFIYTGGVSGQFLKEKPKELLAAAERYQLDVLKNICEDHLCANLQIKNAVEHLVFGDLHQASKLRMMAMKMIARNLVKVVETEDYQNLVKHHPTLAAQIPMALVEDKII